LVPAALGISAFAPWLVTPLLMVGGAFLCFEGFEKLAHKFLHSAADDEARHNALAQALSDSAVDVVALEKEKVKGAIRTDFILSAEIIAITLGTVQTSPMATQVIVLSGIAVLMTLGVYGLVACIVKLDDGGLYMSQIQGETTLARLQRSLGRGVLRSAPYLMKALSVAGTVAMFLVGGGILTHGVPVVHHALESLIQRLGAAAQPLLAMTLDGIFGLLAGAAVLLGVKAFQRLKPRNLT
jgi:predicted DNA repair protein MutK